jgi:DNA-binding Xre family transcriptional regulator
MSTKKTNILRKKLSIVQFFIHRANAIAHPCVSAPSISALLRGQPKQMKADTLDALCTALECTPGDLWVHIPSQIKGA